MDASRDTPPKPRASNPAFASLAALFETVAAGFDRVLWLLDDGMLDADVHEFYALAAELNPGMPYWV